MGEPMLQDRRRTQRHVVNGPAKIQSHVDTPARDCLVADISDGGVRLVAAGMEVPEEFDLLLEGVGGRKCRIVWRLGDEIGAEFVDADGFPQRLFG